MPGPDRGSQHDDAWRQQLAALGGDDPVEPRALRDTEEALRRAGILRGSSRFHRITRRVIPVAAALVLVIAGAWLGRAGSGSAVSADPRYLLLLLEDSTFRGDREVGADSLVREYSAWAGALAGRGQLIAGEELADEEITLGTMSGPGTRQVAGLFIVSAPNREAALEIARSCPHLRYGGGIVVRPVIPT